MNSGGNLKIIVGALPVLGVELYRKILQKVCRKIPSLFCEKTWEKYIYIVGVFKKITEMHTMIMNGFQFHFLQVF